MNKPVTLVLLSLLTLPVLSQQVSPGGVKNLFIWNTTFYNGPTATLKSVNKNLPDTFPRVTSKNYSMNNNSAVCFYGKNIESNIDLGKLSGYTLFTICQSIDTTSEQVIFFTEGDTSVETVLTDRRLASLSQYKYANYDSRAKNYPRIYSYCDRNYKDTSSASRYLRFGQYPRKQSLPVQAFSGIVPEIILFSESLSFRERLRVESYLSIKYGIPLGQLYPTPYLNSIGDTIWDAEINTEYSGNIAGIGRDDASGLYQSVSESVQSPGLMKISSASTIADKTFLIWGDDSNPACFGEYFSLPKCLGRNWRLNSYNASGTKISFSAHTLAIENINPLSPDEAYWLMIDQTGTGYYPIGKTTYVKCDNSVSLNDSINFKNVTADIDSSGADVFTFLAMPELFARYSLTNPDCNNNGKLNVEIVGGKSPYSLVLSGQSSQAISVSGSVAEFDDITQGSYTLTVTDASKLTYSGNIWVSNNHNRECMIEEQYNIIEGNSITLDASEGMPSGFVYSWTTPSDETINSSAITLSEPGAYYLSVIDTEGCQNIKKVSVEPYKLAGIGKVQVFPNPTKHNFAVRVELSNSAALTITLSDLSGKVIDYTLMKGENYYWYNGTLPKPGLYLITLETLYDKRVVKIVGY